MSVQNYTPGSQNAPFGLRNSNAEGSFYAPNAALTAAYPNAATEDDLIAKAIQRTIFDAAPAQYNALKIIFQKEFQEEGSDEFEYKEQTFHRTALQVDTPFVGLPAVAGVANAQVSQGPINIVPALMRFASVDIIVVFPDNSQGVITNVNLAANQITIGSRTGQGLPAVNAGDPLALMSSIDADGRDFFSIYERTDVITRYNFIHLFNRAKRWSRVELKKWENMGTTNYLQVDQENLVKAMRTDMFNILFNGTGGEYVLGNGDVAKTMWGIFPTMQNAGSANASTTLAALKPTFQSLAFQTNFKMEGGRRFIYGTQEMLSELAEIYKTPGTRYTPNDSVANLGLEEYKYGGMSFVPVPCELFREPSCFPAAWSRRLLVLDQETIQPIKMRGIPQFEMGGTLTAGPDGTRERYKDMYYLGNLSLRMNNPLSSFWIDIP